MTTVARCRACKTGKLRLRSGQYTCSNHWCQTNRKLRSKQDRYERTKRSLEMQKRRSRKFTHSTRGRTTGRGTTTPLGLFIGLGVCIIVLVAISQRSI